MQHELSVIERTKELETEDEKRVSYLRESLTLATKLGLEQQAAALKGDIASIERGKRIAAEPLTEDEIVIWRGWLPTAYSETTEDKRFKLSNYHFDKIPQPVLRRWQELRDAGMFERYEIWTPETPAVQDPVLVGVNGHVRHMLARWGETDANLLSFDDVKRELVRRWHANEQLGGEAHWEQYVRRERTMNAMFFGLGAGFVSFFPTAGIFTATFDPGPVPVILGGIILGAIGLATFVTARRMLTEKHFRRSAIMQAILRHDAATAT